MGAKGLHRPSRSATCLQRYKGALVVATGVVLLLFVALSEEQGDGKYGLSTQKAISEAHAPFPRSKVASRSASAPNLPKKPVTSPLSAFFADVVSDGEKLRGELPPLRATRDVRCPRAAFRVPSGREKPTVFVTSTNAKFLDLVKRRGYAHSLWERRADYPLWVYHENAWEKNHGRTGITQKSFPYEADCLLDVFDAVPGLMANSEGRGARDDGGKSDLFDAFYRMDGVRSLSDNIIDGKALVRKVSALAHAVAQLPDGATAVWVDVDTKLERPFDDAFYSYVDSRDLSYIAESLCRRDLHSNTVKTIDDVPKWCQDFKIETGVVAITVNARTRRFLAEALAWYSGPMLALAKKCLDPQGRRSVECDVPWVRNNIGLNDVFVLNMLLHMHGGEIKHGWFANMPFLCDMERDRRILGHCSSCVSDAGRELMDAAGEPGSRKGVEGGWDGLVSPFFVEDYVTHHHDASGIMTMLHDPNYLPPDAPVKKKDKTTDPEMKLPSTWGSQIHLDPRPACDDGRLRQDCFHSIRCGPESDLKTPQNPDNMIPLNMY